MKIKFKAQDGKLSELIIIQWGTRFYTLDEQIPGLEESNERIMKRHSEQYAGEQSPFTPRAKKASKDVIFGNKVKDKDNLKKIMSISTRSPRALILTNVYYSISDNIVFINFFTDIQYVNQTLI
jgi:hypothetical protein